MKEWIRNSIKSGNDRQNRAFENKDVIVSCNLFFTHPVLNSKQMWRTDIWICGA